MGQGERKINVGIFPCFFTVFTAFTRVLVFRELGDFVFILSQHALFFFDFTFSPLEIFMKKIFPRG